ncbi:MAG: TGS domain-containing protein [Syntrophobacterales bacterium]|nr:MAG: TGS domain-containing protein [Syntrophobacterales bacterium]
MPANLPPQYFEAERQYREARSIPEKIKAVESMLAIMPKHKGTDKLRGQLRSKLSKLKLELEKKGGIGRREYVFNVKREGTAQVLLLGFPNVGKSQLVLALTNANAEVGDYQFTTRKPIPGMMPFENIQIQLVDAPPINFEIGEAWLSPMVRNADALIIMVDLDGDPVAQMEEVLAKLEGMRIKPIGFGDEIIHAGEERFFEQKRALIAANKLDLDGVRGQYEMLRERFGRSFAVFPLSAQRGIGMEDLKRGIFEALDIMRVYTKPPGKEPDFSEPVILKKGSTVEDAAYSVHKDFVRKMKFARIWGSEKYQGQMVKKDYMLQDGDVIEFHA